LAQTFGIVSQALGRVRSQDAAVQTKQAVTGLDQGLAVARADVEAPMRVGLKRWEALGRERVGRIDEGFPETDAQGVQLEGGQWKAVREQVDEGAGDEDGGRQPQLCPEGLHETPIGSFGRSQDDVSGCEEQGLEEWAQRGPRAQPVIRRTGLPALQAPAMSRGGIEGEPGGLSSGIEGQDFTLAFEVMGLGFQIRFQIQGAPCTQGALHRTP